MDPVDLLQQQLTHRPGSRVELTPTMHQASVAVLFRPGPDLLFILRSEREGDPWSGHMAFPGGRRDPVDASPRAAAERETHEELGLDLARRGHWVGRLDELVTPPMASRRQMVVTPHVYRLDADPVLRPNHEVAAVHWFALDRFLRGEGRGSRSYTWQGTSFRLPAIHLDGVEIWGLTLRVLDGMLTRMRAMGVGKAARQVG